MEKISWNDRVIKEEVLHRPKYGRNILQTIKRRETNCIVCILYRDCLLKHVIEGKIERRILVAGKRRRRRRQLLNDLEEAESTVNCKRKH
jgi:hypothetical protein